ncbi:C40 family peptidase [Streptomyces sp. BK340]|uniref:C40 family peptidase n=1 Tax=Streptomyces sp. BK340 TaxID=2572903 RepID=UPI0021BD9B87|nr:C40 family peptidase [Streptomyces sp. BK340]
MVAGAGLLAALAGELTIALSGEDPPSDIPGTGAGAFRYERTSSPDRTLVLADDGSVLATLTDGARTAVFTGPFRNFTEPSATRAVVRSNSWVRLMPTAWARGQETSAWFRTWFPRTLANRGPDVLGVAMEYLTGAPDRFNSDGVRYAGRARYGPMVSQSSGHGLSTRDERSDFYDYLGVPWTFPDGTRKSPEKGRYGDVDCSGFMRLLWGYRMGLAMHDSDAPGIGLPRRAYAIAAYGPGVVIIPDTHERPKALDSLQPGDLVFFATRNFEPNLLNHCGMYIGPDNEGHPRFLSSRQQANGPTFGDLGGTAWLDGDGFYARGFRAARRL